MSSEQESIQNTSQATARSASNATDATSSAKYRKVLGISSPRRFIQDFEASRKVLF